MLVGPRDRVEDALDPAVAGNDGQSPVEAPPICLEGRQAESSLELEAGVVEQRIADALPLGEGALLRRILWLIPATAAPRFRSSAAWSRKAQLVG